MCWRVGVKEVGQLCWNGGELEEHGGEKGPYAACYEGDADGDKDGPYTSCEPVGGSFDATEGRVDDLSDCAHVDDKTLEGEGDGDSCLDRGESGGGCRYTDADTVSLGTGLESKSESVQDEALKRG